ncbi:MAG: transposase, partial [Lactobacillales bacterium]|nr:transposase [Lactobacillales bacterium]
KVTDLAREYGIAEATIYKWKAELTPSKETGMTVEEIKAMKKEMAKIKEENEIMENRWICGFKNSDKKWPKS